MNTTQLIILHNDCMVDLSPSCVHNSEKVLWVLTYLTVFSRSKVQFELTSWYSRMSINWSTPQRTPFLYSTSKRHVKPCIMTWWFYIHAHYHWLPQRPGFGALHSLWYVVIDEAMEIGILKYCLDVVVFSLFFTMYLTTILPQKTPSGMFLRLLNVHIFHIFTFTVYISRHVCI